MALSHTSHSPAQTARQVALGLRIGPLAAASSAMGPLGYRVGFRGGPRGTTHAATGQAPVDDFKVIEHVAIGAVAGMCAEDAAIRAPAALLGLVGPVLKSIRALLGRGVALTPLQTSLLAALTVQPEQQPAGWSADGLCERLNRAASDAGTMWTFSKIAQALTSLLSVTTPDGQLTALVEQTSEGTWRARTE